MADRYSIDVTKYIPLNLRGVASMLGVDDLSNLNFVSNVMRSRDAAARYSEPARYSPTGRRETSDLLEAGMAPLEALFGVGIGRYLGEPMKRSLMGILGIDGGDVDAAPIIRESDNLAEDALSDQIAEGFRPVGRPPDDDPATLALYGYTMGDDGVIEATGPDGNPFPVTAAEMHDDIVARDAAAYGGDQNDIVPDDDAYIPGEGYDDTQAAYMSDEFYKRVMGTELSYDVSNPKEGFQRAFEKISGKSGFSFPDGASAYRSLKSQGVTDAELEARGLMSLRDLPNFDGTAAKKMLSGFEQRMMGGKFSDDIDFGSPLKVTELREGGTNYGDFFTEGGTDYLETVYTLKDANLGGSVSSSLKRTTSSHHPEHQVDGPTLFHTRSAQFGVLDPNSPRTGYDVANPQMKPTVGTTFHLGEIQSDVNGHSREIEKARKYFAEMGDDRYAVASSLYHNNKSPNTPGEISEILEMFEGTKFLADITKEYDERIRRVGTHEFLSKRTPSERVHLLMEALTDVRNGARSKTAKDLGVGKLYDTATITRMALRRSLKQATDSNAQFFTLGTGSMAKQMTFGDLGGQVEYYDKIVPGALRKILNKLGSDSGLEMPELGVFDIQGMMAQEPRAYGNVPGFEMTDNFRKAVSKFGMPVFKNGGQVVSDRLMSGIGAYQQFADGGEAQFSMDQFEQDYRNERRRALRDSIESGKTSFPVGLLQHGANRVGERVSDTVQGIGSFAKSLYNNPPAAAESSAEALEALYNRVAQGDPMAAMQVAGIVASGGTAAAIRGSRLANTDVAPVPPVVFRQSPDYIYGGGSISNFKIDPELPFQKRHTGEDQVRDMIESGYVRVKPTGANSGGNNPQTIYFGGNKADSPETATQTSGGFGLGSVTSSNTNKKKNIALIADSAELHKYIGKPLPISSLKHAWKTLESGELVDILPDILKANQNLNFADGGEVSGPPPTRGPSGIGSMGYAL